MSTWTDAGEAYYKAMSEAKAPIKPTPGLHYRVLAIGDWLVLPELEDLKTLPHRWVLKRRERPTVPLVRRKRVPSARFTEEENARMCNVYMRPWTLNVAWHTMDVPFLGRLSIPADSVQVVPAWKARPRRM